MTPDPRWQTVREGYYERAEMRWMSVEDATIEVPARWLAEQGREIERLRKALRPIVREYDLWAAGADDGEFALWDLPRLCEAIVSARAALRGEE